MLAPRLPLLVWLVVCPPMTSALSYLLLPMMSASHILRLGSVGQALIDRGNNVYMIKHNSIPIPTQLHDSKINFIDYYTSEHVHFISTRNCSEIYTSIETNPGQAVPRLFKFFDSQCNDLLENEDLFNVLKDLDLDFALVDGFSALQCFFAYPRRLGIPYAGLGLLPPLDSFSLTMQFNYVTPTLPIAMSAYPQIPSLLHRLRQWLTITLMTTVLEYRQNNEKLTHFLRHKPVQSFRELRDGVRLWLVDNHPIVDVAKPTVPNVIYVGGLTTKRTKPLPQHLQTFADSAQEGLIIVSFGTVVNHIPDHELNIIIQALNNVTEKVIIATPVDIRTTLRAGILVQKWIPQSDLLAHPNTKLFITHCGASSQHEAIHQGVPMLGIPFQEEQKANAQRMEAKFYGRFLDRSELTSSRVRETIDIVKDDTRIRGSVRKASQIMKDRLVEPADQAAYWLDHVAKYGGAHLSPYTERLAWYELLMLDMMAFIGFLTCGVLLLIALLYRTVRQNVASKFKTA